MGSATYKTSAYAFLDVILAAEFVTCPMLLFGRALTKSGFQVDLFEFDENRAGKTTPSWMGAVHGD